MATADELLAMNETEVVDKTLVISNDLRTITIPKTVTNLGVEYDDDVLVLNFQMPRYIGAIDLSTFKIRINFLNAKGESDIFEISTPTIETDYIMFAWEVGPVATRYQGNTQFNVCLRLINEDGFIDREFNTTPTSLPVLKGLEVEAAIAAQYCEIVDQWKQELSAYTLKEFEKIEQKGAEVEESIANTGVNAVLSAMPVVNTLDFTNFHNGSFTEINSKETITHIVTFDEFGRPTEIGDISIVWGS